MRSRITHPLNVSYLVVGLVFLGISGIWALRAAGVVDTDQLGWLLPLTLVGAGTVGVLALGARSISRGHGRDSAAEADDLDTDLTRELPVDTTVDTTGNPVRHDTRGDLR
jgi:hypothetical protein